MSYNYPAPGNYGQQFNSGQAYAPQSYQPPPGAYSAPPPPGLGQPQPPGSYGIPPSGQHGAPPAPGQHAIQAPPYGTPPPAHYAPHAQYGAPGAPAGAGQMIGGPPRYDGSHSQGAPSQTPQPQPSITFRVTEPGKGILNSEVVDPWQRTGWTVSSPSKKETFIRNHAGDVVGRIEWHTWASSRLDFLGYHGKVKEFIPRGQRKHTRVIQYDEVDYDVVEDRESGTIRIRLDPGGATYAIIRGSTEIEITPAGRTLGSEFVDYVLLVAVCYRSGHSFGDTDSQVGVWAAEGAAAASYT